MERLRGQVCDSQVDGVHKWRTVRYAVSDIPTWADSSGLTGLTRIHRSVARMQQPEEPLRAHRFFPRFPLPLPIFKPRSLPGARSISPLDVPYVSPSFFNADETICQELMELTEEEYIRRSDPRWKFRLSRMIRDCRGNPVIATIIYTWLRACDTFRSAYNKYEYRGPRDAVM